MAKWPVFDHGAGKLTANVLNRLFSFVHEVESILPTLIVMARDYSRADLPLTPFVWAKIDGASSITGQDNRWRYSWTEVELDDATGITDGKFDNWTAKSSGLSGTTSTNYALNTTEDVNDDTNISPGIDITGGDYPSGFSVQAVLTSTIVRMYLVKEATGPLRYVFSIENAHDGTC